MSRSFRRASWRCVALTVMASAVASSAVAQGAPPAFADGVRPLLKRFCYKCHGQEVQQAQVRFDRIDGYQVEQQHLWSMVHERISLGEMPPEDQPQPTPDEKEQILAWIKHESAAAQEAEGTGSVRRLNRRELSAALQDLTGLSVRYSDALSADGTVAGFDTGAEGLQDAADSVAQAMRITRRAVDAIYFLDPPERKVFAADLREVKDARRAFESWKEDGAKGKGRGDTRLGLGLLMEPKWVGERGSMDLTIPSPPDRRGVLRLKLTVAALKPYPGIPDPHLWVEVGAKDVDFRPITGTPEVPQELVYAVQLDDVAIEPEGVEVSLSSKVEIPYAVDGFENEDKTKPEDEIPGGPGLFRPEYDRKKLPPEEQPVSRVILQQIEIEPDYVVSWPPEHWAADVGEIQDDPHSAARLLHLWMERAWRRPVTETEQERFFAFYHSLREEGLSIDEALRAAFQSVLLSSGFRYLPSPVDPDPVVAQHAIASRLSFMLVGAPPDEELRRLAAAGKLRAGEVLEAQVDRLLDDSRSEAFFRPFVTQWLEMEQPITIAMDYFQKQGFRFGRYLKASMREETIGYIRRLFVDNRPASELIESDWTMMNESLAIHYGYKGVKGGELRKVELRDDDPRGGGILGHAGIQSMLCWMGDNWVIYRGAWTLRHILDDPPPPPPLEVPELVPSDAENHGKTFRELLDQHQQDPKCSTCHKSIDPLGFAFQNFDLSGRWREMEYERYERRELDGKIEWRGVGDARPVDAAGQLPRGEEYATFAGCKRQIVQHYMPDVVRGMLKNLMVYATGRKPNVDDMAEIHQIMEEHASQGYPLRDLLKAIFRSQAFLAH